MSDCVVTRCDVYSSLFREGHGGDTLQEELHNPPPPKKRDAALSDSEINHCWLPETKILDRLITSFRAVLLDFQVVLLVHATQR